MSTTTTRDTALHREYRTTLVTKRAFLKSFENQARMFMLMIKENACVCGQAPAKERKSAAALAFRSTADELFTTFDAFKVTLGLASQGGSEDNSDTCLLQLAFDKAADIMGLVNRAISEFDMITPELGWQFCHEQSKYAIFREAEAKLDHLFPVIDNQSKYLLRFVKSGRFLDNGSFVDCSDDFGATNSRLSFVPVADTNTANRQVISFGAGSKFGLQSFCWRQNENRFICEQIHKSDYLQSRTWLLADEEWIAANPFRPVEYARPLRVGDLFLVRTVGQCTNYQKFMSSSESDHLTLRNGPNESCYLVALNDAHGRFVYEL